MFTLTRGAIDYEGCVQAVQSDRHGALIVFSGNTRNHHDGREVVELSYEAYDEMATTVLATIADEAKVAFGPCLIAVSHRIGVVPTGQTSVVIAVSAPHRDKAYLASRYVIDELKQRAPIWKKEIYRDGSVWKANATTSPR